MTFFAQGGLDSCDGDDGTGGGHGQLAEHPPKLRIVVRPWKLLHKLYGLGFGTDHLVVYGIVQAAQIHAEHGWNSL